MITISVNAYITMQLITCRLVRDTDNIFLEGNKCLYKVGCVRLELLMYASWSVNSVKTDNSVYISLFRNFTLSVVSPSPWNELM